MTYWIKTKDGKEYPVRFDQEAIGLFARDQGLSYNDLTQMSMNFADWPIEQFYAFMASAFIAPCRENKIEFNYSSYEDFNAWVSKDETIIVKLIEHWIESQPKAPEEADKKKPLPKAKPGVRR